MIYLIKKAKESQEECRSHHKLVKDCISVDWSVLHGETQTVFHMEVIKQISASGFIDYDCGSLEFVKVRFFHGN